MSTIFANFSTPGTYLNLLYIGMNSTEMYLNNSHTSQTFDLDSNNHTAIGNSTEIPEFWDFETRFEFVFHGLLISCLGIFGLMGNLASIVILSRPQMRNSINTILIALVSCDILLILTSILMFSFTVFRHTGNDVKVVFQQQFQKHQK